MCPVKPAVLLFHLAEEYRFTPPLLYLNELSFGRSRSTLGIDSGSFPVPHQRTFVCPPATRLGM